MAEQYEQKLPVLILEGLCRGRVIAADVVTVPSNYRSKPDIPLSDYGAAVTVFPLMSRHIRPEQEGYRPVR